MCSPVAYFKDSMRREYFVMEILFLWAFPLPLDIQDAFPWHSIAFSSKEVRQFLEIKEKDDTNHYRVNFTETVSPWGANTLSMLGWYTWWYVALHTVCVL